MKSALWENIYTVRQSSDVVKIILMTGHAPFVLEQNISGRNCTPPIVCTIGHATLIFVRNGLIFCSTELLQLKRSHERLEDRRTLTKSKFSWEWVLFKKKMMRNNWQWMILLRKWYNIWLNQIPWPTATSTWSLRRLSIMGNLYTLARKRGYMIS